MNNETQKVNRKNVIKSFTNIKNEYQSTLFSSFSHINTETEIEQINYINKNVKTTLTKP